MILSETQMKPILGLEKREQIVWSGRPTRKGNIGAYTGLVIVGVFGGYLSAILLSPDFPFWLVFSIFFLIIALGGALNMEILVQAHKYFITNKRFIKDFTLLVRRTESVPLDLVADVKLQQGIFHKKVNCGNIIIVAAGTPPRRFGGHLGLVFHAIHNPIEVTKIASKVRTKRKK